MAKYVADTRLDKWKWCWLVVKLAAAHFVVVLFVFFATLPGVHSGARLPPYQPPWLSYAFLYIFGFPASAVSRLAHLGPNDGVLGESLFMLTCLLWGCVWAEPFRRKYGWQPWRFSIRDLLVATTMVSVVMGLLAYVIQSKPRWDAQRAAPMQKTTGDKRATKQKVRSQWGTLRLYAEVWQISRYSG